MKYIVVVDDGERRDVVFASSVREIAEKKAAYFSELFHDAWVEVSAEEVDIKDGYALPQAALKTIFENSPRPQRYSAIYVLAAIMIQARGVADKKQIIEALNVGRRSFAEVVDWLDENKLISKECFV